MSFMNIRQLHLRVSINHTGHETTVPNQWFMLHWFSIWPHGFFINSCQCRVHGIRFAHVCSIVIILILHNHVMEDDACHHYAPQYLLIKQMRRAPNNSSSSLEDTKAPLHIFSVTLLIGNK
ncbi:unnamed protein product [Prunus armeniaca]